MTLWYLLERLVQRDFSEDILKINFRPKLYQLHFPNFMVPVFSSVLNIGTLPFLSHFRTIIKLCQIAGLIKQKIQIFTFHNWEGALYANSVLVLSVNVSMSTVNALYVFRRFTNRGWASWFYGSSIGTHDFVLLVRKLLFRGTQPEDLPIPKWPTSKRPTRKRATRKLSISSRVKALIFLNLQSREKLKEVVKLWF
jgi:hypothetical protein